MDNHETDYGKNARLTPAGLLLRFCRERRGVVAMEFVILAPLFFLLLMAILEFCVAFAAQEVVANATETVARQFRTGQIKAAEVDKDDMLDLICDRMTVLFPGDCPELEVDLRSFPTYQDAADAFDGGIVPAVYKFEPGPALSKNVLRVFYRWPVILNLMREPLTGQSDGKLLLFATSTWQNEPFDD